MTLRFSWTRFPVMVALAVVFAAATSPTRAQERKVNFYNWSNYIAPGVLEDFTRETGIKVVYDTFDANETLETRLLAGKSGYDVVVPTAYFLQRQITAPHLSETRQVETAQPRQCLAGGDAAARDLRSRQSLRRQLHVGHHRHWLQHQGGAENSGA